MPHTENFEFSRHTALGEGDKCKSSGCTNDATYFDWHAGALCDDCLREDHDAARKGR